MLARPKGDRKSTATEPNADGAHAKPKEAAGRPRASVAAQTRKAAELCREDKACGSVAAGLWVCHSVDGW